MCIPAPIMPPGGGGEAVGAPPPIMPAPSHASRDVRVSDTISFLCVILFRWHNLHYSLQLQQWQLAIAGGAPPKPPPPPPVPANPAERETHEASTAAWRQFMAESARSSHTCTCSARNRLWKFATVWPWIPGDLPGDKGHTRVLEYPDTIVS